MNDRSGRAEEILTRAAANFLKEEANRLSLITVVGVSLSPRGDRATITVSVFPKEDSMDVLHFLRRKRGDFRDYVKKETALRQVPHIEFVIDQN